MWWKKNKWKIIIPVLILAVLAAAFWFGGNAPGSRGLDPLAASPSPSAAGASTPAPEMPASPAPDPAETAVPETPTPPAAEPTPETTPEVAPTPAPTSAPTPVPTPAPTMDVDPETGLAQYLTGPVPDGRPIPVEPQDVTIGTAACSCTISISCATILDNMELCDPEKAELVPADGWVLQPVTVTFYEGESVFNVLQRVCKQQGIHMEYTNTPIYNSAYIEGIHNLYEFDVGELSGWMYKVNDWFPNYGCSRYQLRDGDAICWVYTCDLGYDVGGGHVTGS